MPIRELYNNLSRGCGCVNWGKRLKPYEALYRMLLRQTAKRKYKVNLTYKQFLKFVEIKECHYCGAPIKWKKYNIVIKPACGHNLDRKDNNKDYSISNCVVCCPRCNWSKGAVFTYNEWRQIGKLIQSWEK